MCFFHLILSLEIFDKIIFQKFQFSIFFLLKLSETFKREFLPKGSINLLGVDSNPESNVLANQLEDLSRAFREKGVFSSWTVIHADNFAKGVNYSNQALRSAFFRPNIVFLNMQDHDDYERELRPVMVECIRLEIGILLYRSHPSAQLGKRQMINVWVSDRQGSWTLGWDIGNLDLSTLIAYKLKKNWDATIRLITVIGNEKEKEEATAFLKDLVTLARLPNTLIEVHVGRFRELVQQAPTADLNIFGMDQDLPFHFVEEISHVTKSSCLFVKDSGHESILA